MITLYGIKTCGSVRKAINLLEKHGVVFTFKDLKAITLTQDQVISWIEKKGIKVVLNTKGTTYKTLKSHGEILDSIFTESSANQASLLVQNPLLLKRPIITCGKSLIIGYDEEAILHLIHNYQNKRL
ncbi:arsenate reductase family protein [Helicobacter jaachi]|nr:Spx/MgsR family RNA polymerase-binding regulatory protein [Helicobacter jaachi]